MVKRKSPSPVAEIRRRPDEPSSSTPRREVRWIVPHVVGPAYAHAYLVGTTFTLCSAHHSEGAIYPPAPGVPKCGDCESALARAREVHDDE